MRQHLERRAFFGSPALFLLSVLGWDRTQFVIEPQTPVFAEGVAPTSASCRDALADDAADFRQPHQLIAFCAVLELSLIDHAG
ncbi:MAG: hypothetical protein JNJ76_05505 [Candidatus Competibacter sp.]|nr:hypothetical protein [Candidatus Competibacter sp.]